MSKLREERSHAVIPAFFIDISRAAVCWLSAQPEEPKQLRKGRVTPSTLTDFSVSRFTKLLKCSMKLKP